MNLGGFRFLDTDIFIIPGLVVALLDGYPIIGIRFGDTCVMAGLDARLVVKLKLGFGDISFTFRFRHAYVVGVAGE